MKIARSALLLVGVCAASQSLVGAARAEGEALEEIVVTAQHRTESAQKVPIALSVIDAAEATKLGIEDSTMLGQTVPGLAISHQLNAQSIYLRGVGTIANPGNEGAVATYIDGIYITGFGATLNSLPNIQNVQILKGPQGTLFGRNATGGILSITTEDPTQETKLDAKVGYANYNTSTASVFLAGGLTNTLAASVSLYGRDQESGWGHDLTTGQKISYGKEYNLRTKLLFTPDDATHVKVTVDRIWEDYDYGLNPAVLQGTITLGLGTFQGRYNSVGLNSLSGGADMHSQYSEGVGLEIYHDFGWMNVTSITGYRQYAERFWFDQDMGPVDTVSPYFYDTVKQFTEELRFASAAGAKLLDRSWKWEMGLFTLHKNERVDPLQIGGMAAGCNTYAADGVTCLVYNKAFNIYHADDTLSYAGFVDSTLEVLTDTNLTLGARYTSERSTDVSSAGVTLPDLSVFYPAVPPGSLTSYAAKPTYRVVLDHSFAPDFMAYVSRSRGFKSGGFALLNGPGASPVNPEILDATMVGLKSQWLDHRLQVNAEAFNYKYTNLQISKFITGGSVFVNAAAAHIRGLDLDLVADPVEHLTLRGSVEYLHGRYDSFPGAPMYLRNPAACNAVAGTGGTELPGAPTPGVTLCGFDAGGNPTIRSPQFTGNIGGDYVIPLTAGSLDLAANLYATSSFNWDPDGFHPEHSYALLNASLTYTAPSKAWDLAVYCENCASRAYDSEEFGVAAGLGVSPGNPAVYGIRAGYHIR